MLDENCAADARKICVYLRLILIVIPRSSAAVGTSRSDYEIS